MTGAVNLEDRKQDRVTNVTNFPVECHDYLREETDAAIFSVRVYVPQRRQLRSCKQ